MREIVAVVYESTTAPPEKRFVALLRVDGGPEGWKICTDAFLASTADDAREKAINSSRAATEARKLQIYASSRAKAERLAAQSAAKEDEFRKSCLEYRARRLRVFNAVIVDGLAQTVVAAREGINPTSLANMLWREARRREELLIEIFGYPRGTVTNMLSRDIKTVRSNYGALPVEVRDRIDVALFEEEEFRQ